MKNILFLLQRDPFLTTTSDLLKPVTDIMSATTYGKT